MVWFTLGTGDSISRCTEETCITKKTIGILGGMGPEATINLYLKIIRICQNQFNCSKDNDFPPIFIFNMPVDIPLSQLLEDISPSSKINNILPLLVKGLKKLENAEADFLIMACNTIHFFIDDLRKSVSVPIVSVIEETAKRVKMKKFKRVGLLATNVTVRGKMYENALKKYRISLILPDKKSQDLVMQVIIRTVAGKNTSKDKETLKKIIGELKENGAEAVILGCTDLPLVINQRDSEIELFDSVQIIAEEAVKRSFGD